MAEGDNNLTAGTWLSVWIETDTKRWLRMQAARHDMSMSQYIRRIVEEHRESGTITLEPSQ